jgi:hypothetical protein
MWDLWVFTAVTMENAVQWDVMSFVGTHVSEERVASIFRVEKPTRERKALVCWPTANAFLC